MKNDTGRASKQQQHDLKHDSLYLEYVVLELNYSALYNNDIPITN